MKRKQVVDDDPSADPQDQMDESSPEREEAENASRCVIDGWQVVGNTTPLERTPDSIWDYFLEENI